MVALVKVLQHFCVCNNIPLLAFACCRWQEAVDIVAQTIYDFHWILMVARPQLVRQRSAWCGIEFQDHVSFLEIRLTPTCIVILCTPFLRACDGSFCPCPRFLDIIRLHDSLWCIQLDVQGNACLATKEKSKGRLLRCSVHTRVVCQLHDGQMFVPIFLVLTHIV